MRLIDADGLAKEIWKLHKKEEERYDLCADELKEVYCGVVSLIDEQPTAYDVNGVAKQLEEEIEYSFADFEQYAEVHDVDTEDDWFYAGLKRAVEVVKAGGKNEIN